MSEIINKLKVSIGNVVDKIENRISQDPVGYQNAIEAFTKSCDKLANSNDSTIQNTLQNFAKPAFMAAHRKVRHNAGPIAVQPKSKSRRTYQLRGSGPSQQGRPTQEEARRQQLNILEDSEVVYTSLPTKKQKTAHPHNLELSVSQDRRPERKH